MDCRSGRRAAIQRCTVSLALAILAAAMSVTVRAQSLPGSKCDLVFDAAMKSVDLDDPTMVFTYKEPTSGGSSIGLHITKGDGSSPASFVPTNTSSKPEAEVVAYRFARFLGVSRNYFPVDYYRLGPKATARFRDMVVSTPEEEADRIANRKMVLKELKADANSILGIYRPKPKAKLYTVMSLGREGEFDPGTALAAAISASGPMPDNTMMTLEGVKGAREAPAIIPKERTLELARQLSTIFVIDQLLGQWDRFWGNLEARGDASGRLKFVARDNGGASLDDWEGFDTYSGWVSRYDRQIIERLTRLNALVKGGGGNFAGYTDPEEWRTAAGFISAASYDMFRKKLSALIDERIPALAMKYGDAIYFPGEAAELIALDSADASSGD